MPATKTKTPRPYKMERFGILNPWGQIWSCNTFETADDARKYLYDFFAKSEDHDTSRFKIIPVNVTITAA